MSSLPPFVLFFAAAPLLAFTRGWTRKGVLLLVPVAGGLALLGAPEGQVWTLSLLGYELTPYRVDRLSLLFGYLFHLAFFIGALFALHVQDRTQHVAAMLYAGSALGAVFAGDLMTLFVFWELAALSSVFLVWARRNPQALGAGWRVALGMRYGAPSIRAGLEELRDAGCREVLFTVGDRREERWPAAREWLDARGTSVHAFWEESDEEALRPRAWRFWRAMPRRGEIGIFFGGNAFGIYSVFYALIHLPLVIGAAMVRLRLH